MASGDIRHPLCSARYGCNAPFTSRRSIAAAAPLQRRPFRLLPPPQALAAAGCFTARWPRRAAVAAGRAPLAAGSSASRSQWRARRHCGVGVRGRGSGWGGAVQRQRGAGVAVDGLPRHGGGRVRLLRVRHLCENYDFFISIIPSLLRKNRKKIIRYKRKSRKHDLGMLLIRFKYRAHGMQVGYSAPAQAGIVSDIGMSNSEVG